MLAVIGAIMLVVGVALMVPSRRARRRLLAMRIAETHTAAELTDLWKSAIDVAGTGYFNRVVEVKGVSECAAPLVTPLSKTPCAAFRSRVAREYEETRTHTDGQGRTTTSRHRGSETVSQDEQSTEFAVRDATGAVAVDPRGADISYVEVTDRFEPATQSGPTISFGSLRVTVPEGMLGGRRTLGYRYTEEVLPLGRQFYVLGEANDSTGRLVVGKPSKPDTPFVISTRSEEELTASATKSVTWLKAGAVTLGLLGLVLIGAQLLT